MAIYIYICKLKNNKFDPAYPTVVLKYKYGFTFFNNSLFTKIKRDVNDLSSKPYSDRKKNCVE